MQKYQRTPELIAKLLDRLNIFLVNFVSDICSVGDLVDIVGDIIRKYSEPLQLVIVDPDAAPIVRNIFEMRASGISPHHIADKLNEDGIPIPSDYYYAKLGKPNPRRTRHMWSPETVRQILHNYTYLGHLVQLRTRTVSYKNHKVIKNDEDDMIFVNNTHEPIVSQELWDRVREMEQSVSQGNCKST